MNRGRIMIVDDDQFYHEFCSDVLGQEGYQVKSTYTGEEALEVLKREPVDIMLADLVMPGMDGMSLLDKAKQVNPEVDVIIMTGHASVETAVQALKSGAADYLTKPLNPEALKLTVKRTIELRHLFDENLELRNLVTLYEICQRVSQCLDLEKLYQLSLDAAMQALSGEMGLSFFKNDNEWDLKALRGMDEEEGASLMEALLNKDLSRIPPKVTVVEELPASGRGGPGEWLRAKSALVIPVTVPGSQQGVIVVLRKEEKAEYDRSDMSTARFLAEQIHLSFENALNYSDAQRLVFVDDHTGLFNTRYLDMALQNELRRAKRFKTHLSVLFVDLDFFKNVNDTYGHLAGSKLLIETSKVLKECVREIDMVIRYGGDEFILILIDTDRESAAKVAERIRKTMEESRFKIRDDLFLKITCCVGIATFPEDAETKSQLIHLADKAMYRGKETTRNVVYQASSL